MRRIRKSTCPADLLNGCFWQAAKEPTGIFRWLFSVILRQLREFCVLHGVGGFFRRGGQKLGCDHEALIAGADLVVQRAAGRERQKLIPVLDGRAVDGGETLPRHRFVEFRPLLFVSNSGRT